MSDINRGAFYGRINIYTRAYENLASRYTQEVRHFETSDVRSISSRYDCETGACLRPSCRAVATNSCRILFRCESENVDLLRWQPQAERAEVISPDICTLFCSLAVPDPRVGHTMDVLSPFVPVYSRGVYAI